MKQLIDLYQELLDAPIRQDRTGFGTRSLFGKHLTFDLRDGFPAMTTRPLYFKTMVKETLWFLQGSSDVSYLQENNVKIWESWTNEAKRSIGPMYPVQMRKHHAVRMWADDQELDYLHRKGWLIHNGFAMKTIDQFKELVEGIKKDPYSRRHFMSYWDPGLLPDPDLAPKDNPAVGNMALAPCHVSLQAYVENMTPMEIMANCPLDIVRDVLVEYDFEPGESIIEMNNAFLAILASKTQDYDEGSPYAIQDEGFYLWCEEMGIPCRWLSTQLYQRSSDTYSGLPFNISQYALLAHILARLTNTIAKEFNICIGDAHLYLNTVENATEQVSRTPMALPVLNINRDLVTLEDFEEATVDDFSLDYYQSWPALEKVEVAV